MRKYFVFLAMSVLVSFALASCIKAGQPRLVVDKYTLIFAAEEQASQAIEVTAKNTEWIAIPNDKTATWMQIEKKNGNIFVTVDDNTLNEKRETKLTIKATGEVSLAPIEITVIQSAQ